MPDTEAKPIGLRHAVFLQRLGEEELATAPEVRLGQGAFLVLRLLDVLAPDREPPSPDAFHYQWTATERYCVELEEEGPEGAHLLGLVRIAGEAHRQSDVRLLAPGLLAYAHYLEDDAHYAEALDVLDTLLYVGSDRLAQADAVALRLRLARVNRKTARFDEAERWYTEGREMAESAGDTYSVLVSRLGFSNVLHYRGNLAECEQLLHSILTDAQALGHKDAEAQAQHGLGAVLHKRGQPADAASHLWQAFQLYENEQSRLRALNDLGLALLRLGRVDAAERALGQVVRRGKRDDSIMNAQIELMHCASYRRDRVTFERWRAECATHGEDMAPNMMTDFLLKAAIGQARFGSYTKAGALMEEALDVASENGLHEFEFRIERIKNGLRDCEAAAKAESPSAAEPALQTPALREISSGLVKLGA